MFSGSFNFTHPDVEPFSSAKLVSTLEIGSVNDPRNTFKPIQKRSFEIQLTPRFDPLSTSEILLMTNS